MPASKRIIIDWRLIINKQPMTVYKTMYPPVVIKYVYNIIQVVIDKLDLSNGDLKKDAQWKHEYV